MTPWPPAYQPGTRGAYLASMTERLSFSDGVSDPSSMDQRSLATTRKASRS